jgi:hypothetical protein
MYELIDVKILIVMGKSTDKFEINLNIHRPIYIFPILSEQ